MVSEVRGLAASGYQEVVLTGIHLSSYGIDHGTDLLELICAVNEIEGIKRIRLGSLEPRIITEEFVSVISGMEKICPHFHLSLQSGCDATLKRMNRRYSTKEYYEKCQLLRKYIENPALTTDVIVGFPGETEEEFGETKKFLEKIMFYETHIFKYSRRKGTKAAVMENQVPDEIKSRRSAQLIELGNKNQRAYEEAYIGKEAEVLFEERFIKDGEEYFSGHTKEYIRVAVRSKEDLTNKIRRIILTESDFFAKID